MSEESEFRDPALAINRVYTKKGDKGLTRLVGGQRLSKGADRIEAYGTVDELNAYVGVVIEELKTLPYPTLSSQLVDTLVKVQHQLFNLGSILATLPEDIGPQMPRVGEKDIEWLESEIDLINNDLTPLRSFILPGGTKASALMHLCRTVCRRVERIVVRLSESEEVDPNAIAYINRLSDAFFVWGRWSVFEEKGEEGEVLWDPNLAR